MQSTAPSGSSTISTRLSMHVQSDTMRRGCFAGSLALLIFACCQPTQAALIHRYSFGADANDSVGSLDGTLNGDANVSAGQLQLDGVGDFVSLNGAALNLAGESAVTIELWATINQAVHGEDVFASFGFGDASSNYIMHSPRRFDGNTGMIAAGAGEVNASGPGITDTSEHHYAVVIDSTSISHYTDGVLMETLPLAGNSLSNVGTTNAFIGNSVFAADPEFAGSINEFRIYNHALTASQVLASFNAGASIPEPSTLLLATMGLVGICLRRSKRKSCIEKQTAVLLSIVFVVLASTSASHAALIHRYSFNGTGANGSIIVDSIGGADGVLREADGGASALTGTGEVNLAGGSSATAGYIDLPNGIISALTDATFEGWFTVDTAANWQRLFDFGTSSAGEVTGPGGTFNGGSTDYSFFTPRSGAGGNPARFALKNGAEQLVNTTTIATGSEQHIAITIDAASDTASLYVNGVFASSNAGVTNVLSSLSDVNNWLGRAQFSADPNFDGRINEFRIYDSALSANTIAKDFAIGPNRLIPEPSTVVLLGMGIVSLLMRRPRRTA